MSTNNKIYSVGYTRISEEALQNNTLIDQKKAIDKYALQEHYVYCNTFSDISTGNTINRENLNKMFEYLLNSKLNGKQIKYLIVRDMSRLTRNLEDFFEIKRKLNETNTHIITLENPEATEENMVDLVNLASKNRTKTIEGACDGVHKKIEAGYYHGRAPFGYRCTKNKEHPYPVLEIYEEEAVIIRNTFHMFIEGHNIKDILEKIPEHNNVKNIYSRLKNHIYYGILVFNDKRINGIHKPIISEDMFNKAIIMLLNPKKKRIKKNNKKKNTVYMLNDILYCPECNSKLEKQSFTKNSKNYDYYRCKNKHVKENIVNIEKLFYDFISSYKLSIDTYREEFLKIINIAENKALFINQDIDATRNNIETYLKAIKNLRSMKKNIKNTDTILEYDKNITDLSKELNKKITGLLKHIDNFIINTQKFNCLADFLSECTLVKDKIKCIKESFPNGLYYDNEKIYCKGEMSNTIEHLKSKSFVSILNWIKKTDPVTSKKYMKLQVMKFMYQELRKKDKSYLHLLKLKYSIS